MICYLLSCFYARKTDKSKQNKKEKEAWFQTKNKNQDRKAGFEKKKKQGKKKINSIDV